MEVSKWEGCYDGNWKNLITPESFSHPAKVSPGLAKRIFEHCFERGYLKKNDTCVDPFGGIGGFALFSAPMGIQFIGIELEEKFCRLFRDNMELHRRAWETMGYPMPKVYQGDSRHLQEIIEKADIICTSPPYEGTSVDSETQKKAGNPKTDITQATKTAGYGHHPGQIGNMKSGDVDLVCTSPPWSDTVQHDGGPAHQEGGELHSNYGKTVGNIGNFRSGSVEAVVDLIATSPPYAESLRDATNRIDISKLCNNQKRGGVVYNPQCYSSSPSNIGNLRSGSVEAVCDTNDKSKFEGGMSCQINAEVKITRKEFINVNGVNQNSHSEQEEQNIVQTNAQIMQEKPSKKNIAEKPIPETYWSEMAKIYSECYQILKPNGVLIVVLKSYVKQGRRVPLPMQTLRLLIHLGFEPLERIKAMLVRETVTPGLFGEMKKVKERKSFFRRLAESKGSPKIDWEEVLICRK